MTVGIDTDPAPAPRHLTQAELARRWQISARSLERWRVAGTGPAWLHLGGSVRYRLEDILAFELAHLRRPRR